MRLNRSLLVILESDDNSEETKAQIQLFSADVEDYTGDVLTLLLPRIMNPHGIYRIHECGHEITNKSKHKINYINQYEVSCMNMQEQS